jgi:hypothetical protein
MYDAVFHIGDFAYDMDWVWYNILSLHKCLFPMGSSFILYPWQPLHPRLISDHSWFIYQSSLVMTARDI